MHSHICQDINTLSLTEAVFELISAGLIGPEHIYTFFHVDEVPHDYSAVPCLVPFSQFTRTVVSVLWDSVGGVRHGLA